MRRNLKRTLLVLAIVALFPGVIAQPPERTDPAMRVGADSDLTTPAAYSTGAPEVQSSAEARWQAAASVGGQTAVLLEPEGDAAAPAPTVPAESLTAATWTTELVDAAGGYYVAQAHDPLDGRPSLAYPAGRILRFAHWNGTSWTIEDVSGGDVTGTSLAYSPNGEPAISWRSSSTLKVARKSGSRWTIESVDKSVGEFTAIAYDAAGNPAVAYTVAGRKTQPVRFARRGSTGWVIETVDSAAKSRYVSIAFSLAGVAAISYSSDSDGDGWLDSLWYATRGASWSTELVEGPERGMGVNCDLAFDPLTGEPVVVHSGTTSDGARFTRKGSGGWSTSLIDPCDYCGNGATLTFSSTGVPFVGYSNWKDPSATTEIRVAYWDADAQTWVSELVEALDSSHAAVGVSPSGQATAAYYASMPKDVRFGRRQ